MEAFKKELNPNEMQKAGGGITFFDIGEYRHTKDMKQTICVKCNEALLWSDRYEAYYCPSCGKVWDLNGDCQDKIDAGEL